MLLNNNEETVINEYDIDLIIFSQGIVKISLLQNALYLMIVFLF